MVGILYIFSISGIIGILKIFGRISWIKFSKKSRWNPGLEAPKSSRGPPKSSQEPSKTQFARDIDLKIFQGGGPHFESKHFHANLAPTWRPKRLQNWCQNTKKSMSKNKRFQTRFFHGFGLVLEGFLKGFGAKNHPTCKNAVFSRSLKIVVFLT